MNETENFSATTCSLSNLSSKSGGDETQRIIQIIFSDVGVPLVCGFGVIGNILNLIVLTYQLKRKSLGSMEKSAQVGMIALAVSDLMACALMCSYTLLKMDEEYCEKSFMFYFRYISPAVITFFIINSTWLIVSMAAERYIAVCLPLKARLIITFSRTIMAIIVVYIVTGLVAVLSFFLTQVHVQSDGHGGTKYVLGINKDMYEWVALPMSVSVDFVPCVLLIFFNVCLIKRLHQSLLLHKKCVNNLPPKSRPLLQKNNRKNSQNSRALLGSKASNHSSPPTSEMISSNTSLNEISSETRKSAQRKESYHSTNVSLIAVVIMFLVLVSPVEILKFIVRQVGVRGTTTKITFAITNFMLAVNYSFNFVLYVSVNRSFRRTFVDIFLCRLTSNRRSPTTSSTAYSSYRMSKGV